jgi:FkbM family methyltransferase
MISSKEFFNTAIKQTIWHLLRPFHNSAAWPMKIQAGPIKGAVLVLDLRQNGAYWRGTYDRWILDRIKIRDWLPIGGVAWDCGAYVGYYAALFRRIVGDSGIVVAFEASSSNYNNLRQLPALNHWSNLQVLHLAVGPDHSEIAFAGEVGGASGPIGLSKEYDKPPISERVVCAGVDELVYERGVAIPDFIKFDVESAEEFALHNGDRVFSEKRPVVLLEVHGEMLLPAVGSFLTKYRYLAWDVREFDQPQSTPFTDAINLQNAAATICNTLVCLPDELVEKRRSTLDSSRTLPEAQTL